MPDSWPPAGNCDVKPLTFNFRVRDKFVELCLEFFDPCNNIFFDRLDELAEITALIGRDGTHKLHRSGDSGFFSGVFDFQIAEFAQQRLAIGQRRSH